MWLIAMSALEINFAIATVVTAWLGVTILLDTLWRRWSANVERALSIVAQVLDGHLRLDILLNNPLTNFCIANNGRKPVKGMSPPLCWDAHLPANLLSNIKSAEKVETEFPMERIIFMPTRWFTAAACSLGSVCMKSVVEQQHCCMHEICSLEQGHLPEVQPHSTMLSHMIVPLFQSPPGLAIHLYL